MTEEDAFLQVIIADPDDDGPRLIYADWLEERGDPRGEFIRAQCALARLGTDDPRRTALEARERDLLAAHEKQWVKPLRPWVMKWSFRRGWVEEITAPALGFVNQAPAWFSHFPIRHARVLKVDRCPERFFGLPQLARLRTLVLEQDYWKGDKAVGPLAGCVHLASLTHLTLHTRQSASAQAVAASPYLRNLADLALSYSDADTTGLRALVDSPVVERLTHFRLAGHWIGPEDLRFLLSAPRLARLTRLDLAASRLGESIAEALPSLTPAFQLAELNLSRGVLRGCGMPELAASTILRGVRTLMLDKNNIDAASIRHLTACSHLDSLESLNLEHNELEDAGARVLAEWPGLRRLTRLNLRGNGIRTQGALALAGSPYLGPALTVLLENNRVLKKPERKLREGLGDRIDFQS